MTKTRLSMITVLVIFSVHWAFVLPAADAAGILKMVEEQTIGAKAPRDLESEMIMKIYKGDSVKTRELQVWQKNNRDGEDFRLLKFRTPADVKNIGLLILAEDQMYLYLPEFRRVRRIASSNKRDSFQGSDFSYEDMGTSTYSQHYDPKILKEDSLCWALELNRKSGSPKPYRRVVMTVDKKKHMPSIMDFYDDDGQLWKHAENRVEQIDTYFITTSIKIEDRKRGSYTTMELKNIKADQNLDQNLFSQRFLKRPVR